MIGADANTGTSQKLDMLATTSTRQDGKTWTQGQVNTVLEERHPSSEMRGWSETRKRKSGSMTVDPSHWDLLCLFLFSSNF